MAAWRLAVRALYELGPSTSAEVELHLRGDIDGSHALCTAKGLGLVESPGNAGGNFYPWHLTPLGVDWCEGRVTQAEVRPGGRRWVATWLSALPRGLTLRGNPT